jgi:UPF0755 protein
MLGALRSLIVLVGVVAVLAGLAAWQANSVYRAAGPLPETKTIVIPRGGTEGIAAALERNGVITDTRSFAIAAWLTRGQGPLRSAEYQFPAHASLAQVLDVLRDGKPIQRRLTIPEGLTARQIAALIAKAEGMTGEAPIPAEGAVLPETYAYQWGDDRTALTRRAEAAMTQALNAAWAERAANLPLTNPRDLLVLASIVEKETGIASERARVAGVFVNRLRRGMPLQSDPTVVYAAGDGMPLDRPITRADLDRDTPWNTYRNKGLPPGPIASPGAAALRAVARPAATDELFFVADGSGGHAFARTLEEHNRNVTRWRGVEQQRRDGAVVPVSR